MGQQFPSQFEERGGVSLEPGLSGESSGLGEGVRGTAHSTSAGVAGYNDSTGSGMYGKGRTGGSFEGTVEGVHAISHDPHAAGVAGYNDSTGPGIYGKSTGGVAGYFDGDVQINGKVTVKVTIELPPGIGDCAGDYKPGLILDKKGASEGRLPVALVGKVYCKVDAHHTSIEVGDLLTTSDTPGHAMKADDPFKAFGSVIGKALRPLREGQGLIPILIALQ